MTTEGVTDNTEESPREESWVEDIVCRGLIIGFSPKSKELLPSQFYCFLVSSYKKGGEDRKY